MIGVLYRLIGRLYHIAIDYRYRARIRVLIAKGLVIGKNVTISASAHIDPGYPYLIRIGDNCSLAEGVRVFAHDATTFKFTNGHTRLGRVEIKDNCFIAERVIILPGVTIGPNVLVAAGSVVNRDIPPNSCVAGVPARFYAKFDEFIERHWQQIKEGTVFEHSDLPRVPDAQIRAKVYESVQDGRHTYKRGRAGRDPFTWNVD
jgi:maltose O-acetyltransferase